MAPYVDFIEASSKKAFDKDHRAIINHNISAYESAWKAGKDRYKNLDLAKKRAAVRKHYVIEHLEDHLKTFEQNFNSRGGKTIWAQDSGEARKAVLDIFEQHYVKKVVKSKSMTTEELGLTEFLEKNGVECVETDLGEYIVQISGDRPYHIVTPAMHLSASDIAGIFNKHHGLSENSTPGEITSFVRKALRDKFEGAHAGITGANFLVASTGSVAVTENEGNAIMSASFPGIHIVIAGIEKLLASTKDLELFWPLLATHGTGQEITAYNTLFNGPRKSGEADGPKYMYVILLDNGRSRLLSTVPQRRALACIRCGACLSFCPVYRNIGGHSYGTVYTGPIGAIISPHISGKLREYIHLSYASTLCGRCTEVCPTGIDLHHQLLHNRRLAVLKGFPSRSERLGIKVYKRVMKKPNYLEMVSPGIKNLAAKLFFKKTWGPRRTLPRISQSFRKRYTSGS